MNDKSNLDNLIKISFENEIKDIKFKDKSKLELIEKISKTSKIEKILEFEIVIPFKLAIAALAVFLVITGYSIYPVFKVDNSDIYDNEIQIIQVSARR